LYLATNDIACRSVMQCHLTASRNVSCLHSDVFLICEVEMHKTSSATQSISQNVHLASPLRWDG